VGLDHTAGAANFRDLGVWLREADGRDLLPPGRVFRGGKLTFVASLDVVGSPATVLNLRRGPDPPLAAAQAHLSVPNGTDTNQTHRPVVRRWLNAVMALLAAPDTAYPVYLHCTSGKDRTGIVAGVIGLVVGARLAAIEVEYALSDGKLDPEAFRAGLAHIQAIGLPTYLDRVDLRALRQRLGG